MKKTNNMNLCKKGLTIIIFSLILPSNSLYGQARYLHMPADSLLKWFENANHPFHVWDSIRAWEKSNSEFFTLYDYKSYYQLPSLKPHLLKWLDRDLYYQYSLQGTRDNFDPKNEEDSAYMAYKIRGWITNKKRLVNADSILNDPHLYTVYKDSILDQIVKNKIERMEKLGRPFPSSRAIHFHIRLAYPESYEKIRSFWELTGKKVKINSIYFSALVRMGDPEARKIFDKLTADVVKKNGYTTSFPVVSFNIGNYLKGSYVLAKYIELLDVDKKVAILSEGPSEPFNCDIISTLLFKTRGYKTDIEIPLRVFDDCETHFKYVDEIKEVTYRLIEHYKEKEYYWMSNMPFYKE